MWHRSHDAHLTADLVHFTDEEMYGKFLDLHEVHDVFCNLRGVEVGGGGGVCVCIVQPQRSGGRGGWGCVCVYSATSEEWR